MDGTLGRLNGSKLDNINKSDLPHFRQTPEESKRTVLTRGNSHGSMGCIPAGGQLQPSSTVGAKALSKKAQKIERKKKNLRYDKEDNI